MAKTTDENRIAKYRREMTWQDAGLCNETDPELFYPDLGTLATDAKKVCVKCPVREKCLEWAFEQNEQWGVWGGYTPHERQLMRRGIRIVSLDRVRKLVEKEDAKRRKFKK